MLFSTTFLITSIIIVSIFMKLLSNVYHYKYDIAWHHMNEKVIKYGKIYHWFDFFSLIIPFTITLVVKFTVPQFLIMALAFISIYSFIMSFFFNIFTKHNWFYVGNTETTDIWLRKILNLCYKGEICYEHLTAKQKQSLNFRAALVYFIRLFLAICGGILIEYINYF